MDDAAIRTSLESQFAAGLKMLADCVRNCPEELRTPTSADPIAFWRAAHLFGRLRVAGAPSVDWVGGG